MPTQEALEILTIQRDMQKESSSLSILHHFSESDHKSLQFMFNAEYQIVLQSFEFKHAAYLEKKLAQSSKCQQSEQIMRKYQILSQKNHTKISKHNSHIDRLLNRLEYEWGQKRTHPFHRYYFEKYIDNDLTHCLDSLEKIILNEEKLIKSELHILYAINRAIKAREACLMEIRRVLGTLSGADIEDHLSTCDQRLYYYRSRIEKLQYKIQSYKINKVLDKKVSRKVFDATKFQQLGQLLNHYRKLTAHAVEMISKWKEYIYSLTYDRQKHKEPVDFYFQNENYLLRAINDSSFVSNSFLNVYFRFSHKNDPFLLMPLITLENEQLNLAQKIQQNHSQQQENSQLSRLKSLKKALAPSTQTDLLQMLQIVQVFTREYQANIKKRKTFDLRTIHQINNLDCRKSKNLSQSQIKLNFKNKHHDLNKSTVTILRSSSIKLSKISTQKAIKTLQSVELSQLKKQVASPLKKQSSFVVKKRTLMKLSDGTGKKETIYSRDQSSHISNPQSLQIVAKHSQLPISSKLLDPRQLQSMKQQIKQRIKSQLHLTHNISHTGIFKKPQLASYIDDQVRKLISQSEQVYNMNNMMTKLSKDVELTHVYPENQMFVETYAIEENQFASHFKLLFQQETLLEYDFMQYSMQELLNGKEQNGNKRDFIQNLPCMYFLKVKLKILQSLTLKQQTLSNFMFTIKHIPKPSEHPNRNHQKIQRTIDILYMTIKSHNVQFLQKTILKAVQFFFKYQTANNVIFTFFYHQDVQSQKDKLTELKSLLGKGYCTILEKMVSKKTNAQGKFTMTQVKICFSRKVQDKANLTTHNSIKNIKSDPASLLIEMNAIFSAQKLHPTTLQAQSQQKQILSRVNYDYLLTEILKNHVDSDEFRAVGKNALWQHRLRAVIENILMLKIKQKGQQIVPFLEILTFDSIQNLNKAQNHLQKSIWTNLSDIQQSTPQNPTKTIKLMSLQLKISLPYLSRAFINCKGQSYFRFEIKQQIDVLNMHYRTCFKQKHQLEEIYEQKIYLFECSEKKNIRIGLFDATKISQFIHKENAKLTQDNTTQTPLTISDMINSLSFMNIQNHGRSMKLICQESMYVGNMFIPMFHRSVPSDSKSQASSDTVSPIQSHDLKAISKNDSNQLFLNDRFLWHYDLCLENGIRYDWTKEKNALVFESSHAENKQSSKRMGIVVFLIPQFIVMYAKIV